MGGTTKYDYKAMEAEYVAGDMTIRALAMSHGVAGNNVSSVHEQARKRDWVEKRSQYRTKATEKALELSVDGKARGIARRIEVQDEAVETISQTLAKIREDLTRTHQVERGGMLITEPVLTLRPAEAVPLLTWLQSLLGQPSLITEERKLGIDIVGSADLDTLKKIAAGFRSVPGGTGAGSPAGGSPLPSAPGTSN